MKIFTVFYKKQYDMNNDLASNLDNKSKAYQDLHKIFQDELQKKIIKFE